MPRPQAGLTTYASTEQWRAVPGFPGYEVSDLGSVVSRRRWRGSTEPRALFVRRDTSGYSTVRLRDADGNESDQRIHRLVLEAFVGRRPEGMVTRHLNGDQLDNRLSNLRYGTPLENNLDTIAHGRHVEASRTHCDRGHELSGENVLGRSDNGGRKCRECERQKAERHNWKRRGLPKRVRGAA